MRMLSRWKKYIQISLLAVPVLILAGGNVARAATAAVQNPAASAKVSFTFDDGLASAYTKAAPTLQKYGIPGTDYVITGCVGMTTVPNTCAANGDAQYMTWTQVQALQNTYGWEIGSHTVDHPQLATNKLTNAQLDAEFANSKSALASHGVNATDFASPYGDYNPNVLAHIAKYYETHRGFADTGYNDWPNNEYLLRVQQVQGGVSVATVQGYIDQAIANHQWLVLVFHDIKDVASANPQDYEYATSDLDKIAAYVKQKTVPAVKITDGIVRSSVNMLTNGGFDQGLTGWTTNSPTTIHADALDNGSYPSSTNSVILTATTKSTYLESPKVAVDSTQAYMLKSYLNVVKRTSGEVGFYVDEYDANGNWISGQWKKAESSVWTENMDFAYTPTNAAVKQASLQVYVNANSGIKAYVDNFQWFPLQGSVPTPPPVPTSTNLMPNGAFDSGLSSGWTTDDATHIKADAGNNGSPSNPANALSITATTKNIHAFSPQITLTAGKTYSLAAYVNVKQLTSGEVGFYVDEYDANGNWISGQYKTGARSVSSGDINFAYTPTSTNVKKASLQVIIVANSGIQAFLDDVRWFQN